MNLQQSVEFFVAVQSLVMGVSHIVQPRAWVDFFVWLREKGHAGVFANGFLSLWFGTLIVPDAVFIRSPGIHMASIRFIESTDVPFPDAN